MKSGLLPRLPVAAAVCLRAVGGCGGEVLPGAAVFFLESQANGLESFRDMAEGISGLVGGAVVEETDGARFEVRQFVGGREAETEDRLCERSELSEPVVMERPRGSFDSAFSSDSLRWTSSNVETRRAVRRGDFDGPSTVSASNLGLIISILSLPSV